MADTSRIKELQTALQQKTAENKAIADSFKVEEGVVVVDQAQKTAFDQNMSDIKEIKSLIAGLESLSEAEQWGSEQASESVAAKAAAFEQVREEVAERFGSVGEAFLASDEFKSLQGGRNGANMPSPFQYKGALTTANGYNVKDIYSAMPSGTPGQFGSIQRDPIVIPPQRTRRVRDLFPVRTTSAAIIEYFRMTGFTNNAATVAERGTDGGGNPIFGAKPQSTMTFEGVQAPVRTIAHWEAAHRNVLADEPQLRSIIDNELMYGLRLQEDAQILSGDGTGENLTGVLNTAGIQNYDWANGATTPVPDTKADAIRRAATLSFLAYYEPTGVVLHPNDWEDIELTKDSNGQYLVAVSVALGGEPRVWRLPVVETPAIAEGTALVGAFGTGAQLYDREQANIRISEQHSDFFVRNAIVVLAEQRLAMAVKRPEAFVKVDFSNGAPVAAP
jgi:HK97 family phage major capsid protein